MVRVLVFIAIVFALAAGLAWLAERPGEIAVTWLGYEIQTSLMVAALAAAALLVLIAILWILVRAVLNAPKAARGYFQARRRDRGYDALSKGMIALGAGDEASATRNAAEARRLLGAEPLALLLAAQSAQLRGDRPAARTAFQAMLSRADTKLLGLHGLFVEAQREGSHTAARLFAEEAAEASATLAWAGTALFDYQSSAGDWDAALATLARNVQGGFVDRPRAQRLQAVLQTARALDLEAGSPDHARQAALEAHRLAPDLVPAAVIAARLLVRLGDPRRAAKVIETSWKIGSHPELADAYAALRPGDSLRERLRRVRRLADLRPYDAEGSLAVARTAIDAKAWPEARAAIAWLAEDKPSERACLLMAEIEEGEGDRGRVRDWLARSVRAPRDPVWLADGQAFDSWAPLSPVTGRLDAFEWKVPPARLGGPAGVSIDVRPFMPSPEAETHQHELPLAIETMAVPEIADDVIELAPVEPSPPAPPAGTAHANGRGLNGEGEAETAPARAEKPEETEEPAFVRAPDNPGPPGAAAPSPPPSRKRFFLF